MAPLPAWMNSKKTGAPRMPSNNENLGVVPGYLPK